MFDTWAGNLTDLPDTNDWDAFVYDLVSGTTKLVSRNKSRTATGDNSSFAVSMNFDGNVVVFQSEADDLVEADFNSKSDIFVADLAADTVSLVTASRPTTDGQTANGESTTNLAGFNLSSPSASSEDGRYLVFVSRANNLVETQLMSTWTSDVYRYDRATGEVVLVSVNIFGTGGGGRNSFEPVISDDGNFVAFTSWSNYLIPNRGLSSLTHRKCMFVTFLKA